MSPRDGEIGGGPLNVAVIGGGVSGLGAAWLLSQRHRVTLYEKDARLGGHSNTVTVPFGGRDIAVDTGFIVFNERTYPNLIQLFARLGVATHASDMSFAVSVDQGRFEYLGGDLKGLFAQPSNLLRPAFWRLVADCLRFFREAPDLMNSSATLPGPSLGAWLERCRFSRDFVDEHLLPMAAAIWSVPLETIREFPARSFAHFFHDHGLLQVYRRPPWRTVTGGSGEYVKKLAGALPDGIRTEAKVVAVKPEGNGVLVRDVSGAVRRYDRVIIAAHADQALQMLDSPTDAERRVLGAFRYQPNLAVLHRDTSLMPRRRRAWGAWNYLTARDSLTGNRNASVTYWMNRLQRLDPDCPLFVSLNPLRAPRDELTIAAFEYHHPIFNAGTLAAQAELATIQGARNLWFCGSWCGYGFHEDALTSGLVAAEALGVRRPWSVQLPEPVEIAPVPAAARWRPALENAAGD